jgi:hypothetical protein
MSSRSRRVLERSRRLATGKFSCLARAVFKVRTLDVSHTCSEESGVAFLAPVFVMKLLAMRPRMRTNAQDEHRMRVATEPPS